MAHGILRHALLIAACGILFPDQRLNWFPFIGSAESSLLNHYESPPISNGQRSFIRLFLSRDNFLILFIFIFACPGSSLLCEGFVSLQQVRAPQGSGWLLSGSRRAQSLGHLGLAAPWHVGSSWGRDRNQGPCICRRILNHWTPRDKSLVQGGNCEFSSGEGRRRTRFIVS